MRRIVSAAGIALVSCPKPAPGGTALPIRNIAASVHSAPQPETTAAPAEFAPAHPPVTPDRPPPGTVKPESRPLSGFAKDRRRVLGTSHRRLT